MEKIKLNPENIKYAEEFVDGAGGVCKRMKNGRWKWLVLSDNNIGGIFSDEVLIDEIKANIIYMRNAYITKFLPGCEPEPKKEPVVALEKWVAGYVVQPGDGPMPAGALFYSPTAEALCVALGSPVAAGSVLVRMPPAPKAPERVWRPVMLEVSGEGADARVRLPDEDEAGHLFASTIADDAPPVPPRPSRDEVKVALRRLVTRAEDGAADDADVNAILDLCCGKENDDKK